jgi:hypothetical protein
LDDGLSTRQRLSRHESRCHSYSRSKQQQETLFIIFIFFLFFSVGCCRGRDIARGKNNKGDFLIESDGGHQRSTTKKRAEKKRNEFSLSSPSAGSAAFQPVRPKKEKTIDDWGLGTKIKRSEFARNGGENVVIYFLHEERKKERKKKQQTIFVYYLSGRNRIFIWPLHRI